MIRTNVVLDERLIKTGLRLTGLRTQRALIDYALRELLRHEDQKKLLELRGNVDWRGNLSESRQGRND
jgi:Arc/MetJ family transcription regulator